MVEKLSLIVRILQEDSSVKAVREKAEKSRKDLDFLIAFNRQQANELKKFIEDNTKKPLPESRADIEKANKALPLLEKELKQLQAGKLKAGKRLSNRLSFKIAIAFAAIQLGFLSTVLATYFFRSEQATSLFGFLFKQADSMGLETFIAAAVVLIAFVALLPLFVSALFDKFQG